MSDDSHGEELEDLEDALFGDGTATPAPVREPPPSSDIDWFRRADRPLRAGVHIRNRRGSGRRRRPHVGADAAAPTRSAPCRASRLGAHTRFRNPTGIVPGRRGADRRRRDLRDGGRAHAAAAQPARAACSPTVRPAAAGADARARARAGRARGGRCCRGRHRRWPGVGREIGGEGGRHCSAHDDGIDPPGDHARTGHRGSHRATRDRRARGQQQHEHDPGAHQPAGRRHRPSTAASDRGADDNDNAASAANDRLCGSEHIALADQPFARKWGMTFSPHWRIVSMQAACGTVPIWIRHMISSAPASSSCST